MSALATTASDTLVLAGRNLKRIPRQPDLLVGYTIQPVMFVLLFVYVFGGAIQTPGFDYVDFLMPGIIVQSIAFGARPYIILTYDKRLDAWSSKWQGFVESTQGIYNNFSTQSLLSAHQA